MKYWISSFWVPYLGDYEMVYFIFATGFFFPWCECCRGEVHYNISFGVGASQIPRKIGVTHRGFCHGVYPWKGETNGWLVVWNMNFMTSLRVGMFFFNLTFTPSFFRGGVLPNHINNQPDGDFRWFFGDQGMAPWSDGTLDRQDSAPIIKDVYSWRKHPSHGSNVYSWGSTTVGLDHVFWFMVLYDP